MTTSTIIIICVCVVLIMIILLVIHYIFENTNKILRTQVGIPVPDRNFRSMIAYRKGRELIREYKKTTCALSNIQDSESHLRIKIDFADKKLAFFYDILLSSSSPFFVQRIPLEERRKDEDEENILTNSITSKESEITKYLQLLNDNKMSAIISEADNASSMDISGFIRKVSVRKLKNQTETYKRLYQVATDEYKELKNIASKMDVLLDYIRACAFRNLYLGSELLNIVRDNSGGGNLQKANDYINLCTINCNSVEVKGIISSYDLDAALSGFSRSFNSLYKNEFYRKFTIKNPKLNLYIQALLLIDSLIEQYENKRNKNIDNLLNMQKQLTNLFSRIVAIYNESQPIVVRSLELALAIVEANKGFIKIYAPLRDKVYSQTGTISRQDAINLSAAMNEYNKINNSKL